MKLNEAIKEVIEQFGINILSEARFVNIIDDLGGYKDLPGAYKNVMRKLVSSEISELVIPIYENTEAGWQNRIDKWIKDFINNTGFSHKIVEELVSNIVAGVGIINSYADTANVSADERKERGQRKKINKKDLLISLQEEYKKTLQESLIITKDELGLDYGYFDADARTKLYLIESKLLIIAQATSTPDIDLWIANEKRKIEKKHRPSPQSIKDEINKLIKNLETEFIKEMNAGYVIEFEEFGLKVASFTPEAEKALSFIEFKLQKLWLKINENKKTWITKTRKTFLESKGSTIKQRQDLADVFKGEYLERLKVLDEENKKGDIDFNDKTLTDLRNKIIKVSAYLNKDGNRWCDKSNNDLISKRVSRDQLKRKQLFIFVGIIFIFCLIILFIIY